ncbi:MAG: hypothetical protein ACRDMZ_05400 [Solirubrobacteraceae bacterium]
MSTTIATPIRRRSTDQRFGGGATRPASALVDIADGLHQEAFLIGAALNAISTVGHQITMLRTSPARTLAGRIWL